VTATGGFGPMSRAAFLDTLVSSAFPHLRCRKQLVSVSGAVHVARWWIQGVRGRASWDTLRAAASKALRVTQGIGLRSRWKRLACNTALTLPHLDAAR
jgi:hypothetical protein